jgi:hypothetical protein
MKKTFQLSYRLPFCKREMAVKKMTVQIQQWFDAECTDPDYKALCSMGGKCACGRWRGGSGGRGRVEREERLH